MNTRPSGSLSITGTLRSGELLTVNSAFTDANGIPAVGSTGAVRFQWHANGAAIAGATGTTYRLTAADIGSRISVTAAYVDLGGTEETVTSAASAAVLEAPNNPAAYSALPRVRFATTLGDLVVELEADRAPITVNNFLRYANANFYDGTEFHRIISSFMAQGGGYDLIGTEFIRRSSLFPAIALERTSTTGLSNLAGTLAMARTSAADSATSEFFVNLVDNQRLDAALFGDGNGYAVFGRVVSGGAEVLPKLKAITVVDNGAGEVSKPTTAVTLNDVVTEATPAGSAPNGSVAIVGLPVQGRALFARAQLSDADGIPAAGQPGAISYYWKSNGALIPGAHSNSLTLTQALVGTSITAVASYTDLTGTSGYVASAPVKVIDANDSPAGRVVISGAPTAGNTLNASHSLVDLDGIPGAGQPGAIRWQWHVDGQPVPGMTQAAFTVAASDSGKSITVTASYTDLAGTPEIVASAPAGLVPQPAPTLPRAWLRTNYGDLLIELESTRAAGTVANFVQYIQSGFYTSTVFHRVIDGFMIQGGGYTINASGQYAYKTPTQAPISLESTSVTGLSNTLGTVAMARTGDPNSATSQFFINVADNLFLDANRAPDGKGYAVFGRVLDGYPILDLLKSVPVRANSAGGEVSSPTVAIGILGSYYDPKPPGGEVLITGRPMQGQTLVAQHTLIDPDGLTTNNIGWVWRVDGTPVTGISTSTTFLLTPFHVGRSISVELVYRDNAGNFGYVPSAETAEVGLPIDSRVDLAGTLAAAGVTGVRAAAVTGSAYHWRSHAFLDDVSIKAQAAEVSPSALTPVGLTASTGNDGRWTIDSLDFDTVLRFNAERAATAGEITRAVSASDALAALKLASGRNPNTPIEDLGSALPISPYQVLAADVNRDGRVSSEDASLILKAAARADGAPALQWRFVDESALLWQPASGSVYTRQSVPKVDAATSAKAGQASPINLVGVLTGDVDGSWTPGSAQAAPEGSYDVMPTDYFRSLGLTSDALAQWGIAPV